MGLRVWLKLNRSLGGVVFHGIMTSYNLYHDLHVMMDILSHTHEDLSELFLKVTDISQELVLNQFKNI